MNDQEIYFQRLHIISVALVLLTLITVGRMFYLQVIRHGHYKSLAGQEQLRKFEVSAQRGDIYLTDRGDKKPVAIHQELKTLYVDPRFVEDKPGTARALANITGASSSQYESDMQSESFYVVLKKKLTSAQAEAIEKLNLSGVGLIDEPTRVYPEGSLAAQVLGFVNSEGLGQYGIEEQFNDWLGGSKGLLKATTDTRGIPIATSDNFQVRPQDGGDVVLTIDRNIQAHVEKVLREGATSRRAKSASAVVMDPNTGAIKAMANYPTFDASKIEEVNDYSLLSNRAATELFEPGSGFKIYSMATALDKGAVRPDTTFTDTGVVEIDDKKIENAAKEKFGTVNMTTVITKSINTGVVFALRQIGGGSINEVAKNTLYDYYHNHFNYGKPTGIEVPAEPSGELAEPGNASNVQYANMTFGQGVTATMVQIVTAMSAVVNGGTIYKPFLVDHTVDRDGNINKTLPKKQNENVISQETSNQLKAMMETVVQTGGGTSTKVAGYRIGGKTGTAQIPNPEGGYFNDRDIGTFTGAAPLGSPRYVLMVRIDEPQGGGFAGSAAAAPMWGEIMSWLLQYGGVPPQ
jgi:cell division protein FtsI (penicillin-binding protein 3)